MQIGQLIAEKAASDTPFVSLEFSPLLRKSSSLPFMKRWKPCAHWIRFLFP